MNLDNTAQASELHRQFRCHLPMHLYSSGHKVAQPFLHCSKRVPLSRRSVFPEINTESCCMNQNCWVSLVPPIPTSPGPGRHGKTWSHATALLLLRTAGETQTAPPHLSKAAGCSDRALPLLSVISDRIPALRETESIFRTPMPNSVRAGCALPK